WYTITGPFVSVATYLRVLPSPPTQSTTSSPVAWLNCPAYSSSTPATCHPRASSLRTIDSSPSDSPTVVHVLPCFRSTRTRYGRIRLGPPPSPAHRRPTRFPPSGPTHPAPPASVRTATGVRSLSNSVVRTLSGVGVAGGSVTC